MKMQLITFLSWKLFAPIDSLLISFLFSYFVAFNLLYLAFCFAGTPHWVFGDGNNFFFIIDGALSSSVPCIHDNDIIFVDTNS